MTIKTSSTMSLSHFHDFYFLQAMQAAVTMNMASNPELEFSKPVEKFIDDLERTCEKVYPNMALRTFMYLYAACLGEARHAKDTVACDRFVKSKSRQRSDFFATVSDYPPTDENLKTLVDVFAQPWRSGYGGTAWMHIAEALTEYSTTPPAAWLDHVVDLEHNNGTAFSKPDGLTTIMFDVSYPSRFSRFLDFKFQKDILSKSPSWIDALTVSPRIGNLITRYGNAFKKQVVGFSTSLPDLGDYVVEWGNRRLAIGKKWKEWASIGENNKPNVQSVLNEEGGLYNKSCFELTAKEFEAHVSGTVEKAKKSLGKFATPSMVKSMMKFASDYFNRNKDKCKLPKAKITYSAMPCTVKTDHRTAKNILYFALPHQDGYGEKTENGFSVVVYTYQDIASESAYVTRRYGDIILYYGKHSTYITSAQLEGLID